MVLLYGWHFKSGSTLDSKIKYSTLQQTKKALITKTLLERIKLQ